MLCQEIISALRSFEWKDAKHYLEENLKQERNGIDAEVEVCCMPIGLRKR